MVKHIMLIILCLGVLSTVTGCYVEPSPYGTSSSGVYGSGVGAYQGEPYRDDEARRSRAERPYQRQWWEQDQGHGRDQFWEWQQQHPHTPLTPGHSEGP